MILKKYSKGGTYYGTLNPYGTGYFMKIPPSVRFPHYDLKRKKIIINGPESGVDFKARVVGRTSALTEKGRRVPAIIVDIIGQPKPATILNNVYYFGPENRKILENRKKML